MRRLPRWPLAWGSGLALGVVIAALLGPHVPGWGAALAFPSVALLFALGSWKELPGESEEITHLLRSTMGAAIGFLALGVPLALLQLARLVEAAPQEELSATLEHVARMRTHLLASWAIVLSTVPIGLVALYARARRERRSRRGR